MWSTDLSIYNKVFFYYVLLNTKYVWVVPLKDKKCITITNAFQKISDESNHSSNKI